MTSYNNRGRKTPEDFLKEAFGSHYTECQNDRIGFEAYLAPLFTTMNTVRETIVEESSRMNRDILFFLREVGIKDPSAQRMITSALSARDTDTVEAVKWGRGKVQEYTDLEKSITTSEDGSQITLSPELRKKLTSAKGEMEKVVAERIVRAALNFQNGADSRGEEKIHDFLSGLKEPEDKES